MWCVATCENFDGLLSEISSYCKRTGRYLPLLEHGVAIRGHRTIIDSATAVPFFTGARAATEASQHGDRLRVIVASPGKRAAAG